MSASFCKKNLRKDVFSISFLILIVLCAAILRFYFLSMTSFNIDSDEAIVGLMAKHIIEGKSWPIFYYGQHYMGSLESICVAGVFLLLGEINNWGLKIVPLLFSLVFIVQIYFYSRRFTSHGPALAAAFAAALGPSSLLVWSTKARGGFIEILVLGMAALMIMDSLFNLEKGYKLKVVLLGLICGLAWWVNNQFIYYLFVIALFLPIIFWQKGKFQEVINSGLCFTCGFFAGSAPFWWANLAVVPRLQTFRELSNFVSWPVALKHASGFFSEGLPIIFGAREFWCSIDKFPQATLSVLVIYGTVFLCVIYSLIFLKRALISHSPQCKKRIGVFLVLFFSIFIFFSFSKFGWLSHAPRYLLPVYTVIFPLFAIVLNILWKWEIGKIFSSILFSSVIFINLFSIFGGKISMSQEPFINDEHQQRVSRNHEQLYKWLSDNNYDHIYTGYWIGYRTAFETKEKVTFTMYGKPRMVRIPEYEIASREKFFNAVYVLSVGQAGNMVSSLSEQGFLYRTTRVGDYVIVDHVMHPRMERSLKEVDSSELEVQTSTRKEWKGRLIDNILGSRWGAVASDTEGAWVKLTLKKPKLIAGLRIFQSLWPHDKAERLSIEVEPLVGEPCIIYRSLYKQPSFDVLSGLEIYFKPRLIKSLTFKENKKHDFFDWSISEIDLFEVD